MLFKPCRPDNCQLLCNLRFAHMTRKKMSLHFTFSSTHFFYLLTIYDSVAFTYGNPPVGLGGFVQTSQCLKTISPRARSEARIPELVHHNAIQASHAAGNINNAMHFGGNYAVKVPGNAYKQLVAPLYTAHSAGHIKVSRRT